MIRVKAPSNIALVKYMGKTDAKDNLACNHSLSLTLGNLYSEVRMAPSRDWHARVINPERALNFLKRLEVELPPVLEPMGYRCQSGPVSFESSNTFPAGAGIASSASAFAALTTAYAMIVCPEVVQNWEDKGLRGELAALSQKGSGSSCRSFLGPFVRWDGRRVHEVSSSLNLCDLVLLVDAGKKAVGSSEAHQRVLTSPLWSGRIERANDRCDRVQEALQNNRFQDLAREVWAEAWEMHSLFHTTEPPFSYWKPGTMELLEFLGPWAEQGRMAVTLDAGPNLHVIIPLEEKEEWISKIQERFPQTQVLSDQASAGPTWEQL